ncbi:MAG: hypothetical protein ACH34U_11535, partial [Cyanobium sp.]
MAPAIPDCNDFHLQGPHLSCSAPSWRDHLRATLAALPPERRRELRAYASPFAAAATLQPNTFPAAPLLDL